MTSNFHLRPIAFADSPQSDDGEALQLPGRLSYTARALERARMTKIALLYRCSLGREHRRSFFSLEQWSKRSKRSAPAA